MIWHPMLLSVLLLQALALALWLWASMAYLGVTLRWSPSSPHAAQIRLERAVEAASLSSKLAIFLYVCAVLTWIVAVASVLPRLIPGAMCGTGVLQAMEGQGERALLLQGVTLCALALWHATDRLNRTLPRATLTPFAARIGLLALPLVALSWLDTYRAIAALNPYDAVDCCAVVYDSVRSTAEATSYLGWSDAVWLTLFAGASFWLGIWAMAGLFGQAQRTGFTAVLAILGPMWCVAAAVTLVKILSAYHYGVLHHHCPWCLFLPEHRLVGYPLFLALIVIFLESFAPLVAGKLTDMETELREVAALRVRSSLKRILLFLLIYLAFSVGPTLVWRWRFGVWMH